MNDASSQLEAIRASAIAEAEQCKNSMLVVTRLLDAYRGFAPAEREEADRVLAEWTLADEESRRYDALAVIRELRVTAAVPALRERDRRLDSESDPGAPFEQKKVRAVLDELEA